MNQLVLSGSIAEVKALRYTPAGIPALDLRIEHESQITEAGHLRQVTASMRAVALGTMAETLGTKPLGSAGRFSGFLATPRHGKSVVFHIQQFQQD